MAAGRAERSASSAGKKKSPAKKKPPVLDAPKPALIPRKGPMLPTGLPKPLPVADPRGARRPRPVLPGRHTATTDPAGRLMELVSG
jgi:hypothetical protein